MKKKKILGCIILFLLGGMIMSIITIFNRNSSLLKNETKPFIFSEYYSENGHITNGKLFYYYCNINKIEEITNIPLRNFSLNNTGKKLIGIKDNLSNPDEYYGIYEYNLESKTGAEIISEDEIKSFFIQKNIECMDYMITRVRYFKGETQISFLYNHKLCIYDKVKGTLDILCDASTNYEFIDYNTLLTINHTDLVSYNLTTYQKEVLIKGAYAFNFAVSSDKKEIVYEKRKEKLLCIYYMDTKKTEELVKLKYIFPEIFFSPINKNIVLYTDMQESFVATNRKTSVHLLDLNSKKHKKLKQWGYKDHIVSFTW